MELTELITCWGVSEWQWTLMRLNSSPTTTTEDANSLRIDWISDIGFTGSRIINWVQ